MQRSSERRIAIDFYVKFGKTAVETFPTIKTVFGGDVLSERQVYRWYMETLEGRLEVNDETCTEWPSTTTSTDEIVTRVN